MAKMNIAVSVELGMTNSIRGKCCISMKLCSRDKHELPSGSVVVVVIIIISGEEDASIPSVLGP